MAEFETVCTAAEIPVGTGRAFEVNGEFVAVFRLDDDTFTALEDTCPHAGAPLSDGEVEEGVVTCPLHAWRFDCRTGKWCDNPKSDLGVRTFEVRVEEGDVRVCVPD